MRSVGRTRVWARAALAVLAGALVLSVGACGSSEDGGSGGESVTITHARGETVIEGTPQKIVALGNQWLDSTLALGVTPAGYIDNVAVASKSTSPWQRPGSLDSATQISPSGNIAEQVAALEPDLILADPFIADQKTYDELSKVAPTLPALTSDAVTPWQEQITTLGKVLGKQDDASKVIAGVDDKIAGILAANPTLRGKTFASTWLAGPAQLMVLTDPNDGSAKVFEQLGMTIPQNLRDLPANQGRVALSPERVDELTADLLLAGYSPGMDERYRQLPGYAELPSVQKGAVVFLTTQEISAVNQPTALSVPYILDKLGPAFAAAAK
ncbi:MULTISPECIES: ABC transporter substrate-binding protein [Nocardia]|uniref:ABC transporter substrate-binding protein n=2 Tax=Nocardiaceae TaxID=85025 RepID=UPI001562C49D|nr:MULTISPECIES: ABC transporter substrate-binding protein [Nocardia]MBF6187436.1 ABC transporter substrate-binding protein [Nocardia farcinica]MBF6314705.1 ABC transporter substrate-binding protein [Nocardia farcinica]MBF6410584.1 ABC transporter substrate-binding protein [Nocardia farcinica]MBF6537436.1 ABC transporter substrate-binding protein [Nocardia farcinica]UEX23610.1 ABC transporter substrate-binding protein [Nocardia farcinica]